MTKTQWREIPGYENLYEVSNKGSIRSVGWMKIDGRFNKPKILKQSLLSTGYLQVSLSKDGKSQKHTVHRLVASAWINNPDNLNIVNHLDSCRSNNHVDNLQWSTNSGNQLHSYKNGREVWNKGLRTKSEIPCGWCKNLFYPPKPNSNFCSKSCAMFNRNLKENDLLPDKQEV